MNDNHFQKKFDSKSNLELEQIALNDKMYVFEARCAAIQILKNRNVDSESIELVENEIKVKTQDLIKKNQKELIDTSKIIFVLRKIPVGKTLIMKLENRNELQIKRINDIKFQVRIEDFYRSFFAPVLICKIIDDSNFKCYPFPYLKSILIIGVCASLIVLSIFLFLLHEINWFIVVYPIVFSLSVQIITAPIFFIFRSVLKEELGKKDIKFYYFK